MGKNRLLAADALLHYLNTAIYCYLVTVVLKSPAGC